ncbi:methyltransferase domain-containing protein [Candidatus Woesearchaeota archaeon]|nr:methyltransferase domain-containing protein [Candidatus Woesearchaeota archaeon]
MKREKSEALAKAVYSKGVLYEWKRLVKDPFHRLEFETTLHFLTKHLPRKGLILDAGGGPGRYSIELAKRGYDVVLFDITAENLAFAQKEIERQGVSKKVKYIVQGSIVDLSNFKSNTFDAVLCLGGALSHVSTPQNRARAVSELIRVARKGAPIAVSVMGRLGVLMNAIRYWPEELRVTSNTERILRKGDDHMWHHKYYAHFFYAKELKELFARKKLKLLDLTGLEGLSTPYKEEANTLFKKDKAGWKNWIKVHYQVCTHPAVVDTSAHMLIITRKI